MDLFGVQDQLDIAITSRIVRSSVKDAIPNSGFSRKNAAEIFEGTAAAASFAL